MAEEALIELEAVQSVYEDDCKVLHTFPAHLHVHIKPRTADVSSQQFVEAILEIRAGPQYPDEPPHISIVDSKGLDEERQIHLLKSIRDRANELSSYSMLVALCEEAVEKLSSMNHPDGECPLCLSPLLDEDSGEDALPFMKLMSCFHCFHCECIIRWWNWLEKQKKSELSENKRGKEKNEEERTGTCPVCRKVFHAKDIEHVLDLILTYSQSSSTESIQDDVILGSNSEKIRRSEFESILKMQEEKNGLIEPKKTKVLLPGMFLPKPAPQETGENLERETSNASSSNGTGGGYRRKKSNMRRNKNYNNNINNNNNNNSNNTGKMNPRKQTQQWIRKDSGSTN